MALLFMESFDDVGLNTTNFGSKYDIGLGAINTSFANATGRPGSANYLQMTTGGGNGNFYKNVPGSNCLVVGFAWKTGFYAGGNQTFVYGAYSGALTTQWSLKANTDNTISLYRFDLQEFWRSEPLTTGYWIYVEVKWRCHATNGDWEVRINGISKCSSGGVQTASAGATGLDYVGFQCYGTGLLPALDDIYVCNTSGALNSDFLGPIRVQFLAVSGAGTYSEWTPSGAATNQACVKEVTMNSDTDFVYSSTPGARDLYSISDIVTGGTNIKGVQVGFWAKKDDALARQMWPMVRSGTTDASGTFAAKVLTNTYKHYVALFETDPNTSALWTSGAVNLMEAGVQCVS